jgi:hypothetical protein
MSASACFLAETLVPQITSRQQFAGNDVHGVLTLFQVAAVAPP